MSHSIFQKKRLFIQNSFEKRMFGIWCLNILVLLIAIGAVNGYRINKRSLSSALSSPDPQTQLSSEDLEKKFNEIVKKNNDAVQFIESIINSKDAKRAPEGVKRYEEVVIANFYFKEELENNGKEVEYRTRMDDLDQKLFVIHVRLQYLQVPKWLDDANKAFDNQEYILANSIINHIIYVYKERIKELENGQKNSNDEELTSLKNELAKVREIAKPIHNKNYQVNFSKQKEEYVEAKKLMAKAEILFRKSNRSYVDLQDAYEIINKVYSATGRFASQLDELQLDELRTLDDYEGKDEILDEKEKIEKEGKKVSDLRRQIKDAKEKMEAQRDSQTAERLGVEAKGKYE